MDTKKTEEKAKSEKEAAKKAEQEKTIGQKAANQRNAGTSADASKRILDIIKDLTVKVLNKVLDQRDEIIGYAEEIRQMVGDTTELEKKAEEHRCKRDTLAGMVAEAIRQNASMAQVRQSTINATMR